MPAGPPLNPVISDAFTVAPEVVYSPIVPLAVFVTNRFDPDTAMPNGSSNPVISEAFSVAPEVVYSPIVPLAVFVTNRFDPDTAKKAGLLNPEISAAFIVAPEVVYSPIVPLPSLVTKMLSPRAVVGIAKIAVATESMATAHRPERTVARVRRNERMALLLSKQQVSGAGVHRGSPSRGEYPTYSCKGLSNTEHSRRSGSAVEALCLRWRAWRRGAGRVGAQPRGSRGPVGRAHCVGRVVHFEASASAHGRRGASAVEGGRKRVSWVMLESKVVPIGWYRDGEKPRGASWRLVPARTWLMSVPPALLLRGVISPRCGGRQGFDRSSLRNCAKLLTPRY